MREKLQPLAVDAPIGTLVLVVEDDRTITLTRTRSTPWALQLVGRVRRVSGTIGRAADDDREVYVVQLARRSGGYLLSRCFLPPLTAPMGPTLDELLAARDDEDPYEL